MDESGLDHKAKFMALPVKVCLILIEWIFLSFMCYFIGSILVPLFCSKNCLLEAVKYDRKLIESKPELFFHEFLILFIVIC